MEHGNMVVWIVFAIWFIMSPGKDFWEANKSVNKARKRNDRDVKLFNFLQVALWAIMISIVGFMSYVFVKIS